MLILGGLDARSTLVCLLLGCLLDAWLGEVRRWHPLVGFGRWAQYLERRWNHPAATRWTGAFAWAAAVLPILLAAAGLLMLLAQFSHVLSLAGHALLLYFCLGLRSLRQHSLPIEQALMNGDLATARQATSMIVSRDTEQANPSDLSKASVESMLENGCDAVFATLFWFLLFGGLGALLHRLANTLDAMWGYRSERLLRFGCVAARIDDVLNYLPARLSAASYALLGHTRLAWHCWRTQARHWPSPNAGPVMAAGAGALQLSLGGVATYDGVPEQRPLLGAGAAPAAQDIRRAWQLVRNTTLLWLTLAALVLVAQPWHYLHYSPYLWGGWHA